MAGIRFFYQKIEEVKSEWDLILLLYSLMKRQRAYAIAPRFGHLYGSRDEQKIVF